MAIYALSGIILIFRNTDAFKVVSQVEETLEPGLDVEGLKEALRMRRFRADEVTEMTIAFESGTYNRLNGQVSYTKKELPYILKKFEEMHKATSDKPLFFLNVFFGVSLLFFVVSSFFMFLPKSKVFRMGLYYTAAGMVLAVVVVYF
ncbi:hypothetical protein H5P27_01735 [Pelagicoccus albus]|uniref:Uncharacterized protein n=2 Tax=Pelagicoccus albus TaxID=415222 RepID=A0A7X1B5I1_9BACT|nr:hypothetical protein [Pelagicoccus albus]